MTEKSTTPEDNQEEVTPTDPTGTDQQTPVENEDNLDKSSKSTEKPADGEEKPTDGGEDDTPAPKFDSDIDEWAEKTGRRKPETDQERADYQLIRDGQREFSRSKQAKESQSALDKAIKENKPVDNKQDDDEDDDDRDPVEKRQDELEARLAESEALRARSEYFSEKSVSDKEADVMGEILKEKVAKGGQAAFDYWTNPDQLEDWHQLAKARLATNTDTSVIEEEAARKERERIAKEHHAGGPSRNATSTVPAKPQGYNRTEYLKADD